MAPITHAKPLITGLNSLTSTFLLKRGQVLEAAKSSVQTLTRRDDKNVTYQPGKAIRPPESFNNKGMLALFALLGAAMVIGAIWFFFWAKNGGFVWRQGDWDDYKSTVMRRRGPDGKTLSNATPHTNLGQKSIAGTFELDRDDISRHDAFEEKHTGLKRKDGKKGKHKHAKREPSDEDVRAYRREKPATVGGLNREADGSHFDGSHHTGSGYGYSNPGSVYSDDIVSNNSRTHLQPKKQSPPKKQGLMEKTRQKAQEKKKNVKDKKQAKASDKKVDKKTRRTPEGRVRPAQRRPSLSTLGDLPNADTGRQGGGESYYANQYRPAPQSYAPAQHSPLRHAQQQPHRSTPTSSRQQAPHRTLGQPRPPGSFDAYSEAGSSDTGTRVYNHHIPGLSRGSRDTNSGYRRGAMGGRRDSLSDSD